MKRVNGDGENGGNGAVEEADKLRGFLEGKRLALEQNQLVTEFYVFKAALGEP